MRWGLARSGSGPFRWKMDLHVPPLYVDLDPSKSVWHRKSIYI